MCAHTRVCVHVCEYRCAHTTEHVKVRGQPQMLSSLTSTEFEADSPWLVDATYARLPDHRLPRLFLSPCPKRLQGHWDCRPSFYMGLGTWTWAFILTRQELYPLCHLPSSTLLIQHIVLLFLLTLGCASRSRLMLPGSSDLLSGTCICLTF